MTLYVLKKDSERVEAVVLVVGVTDFVCIAYIFFIAVAKMLCPFYYLLKRTRNHFVHIFK